MSKKIAKRDIYSGIYQHYKGKLYLVLGVARHSETEEKFMVYIPLYTTKGPRITVRPLEMFLDKVEVEGVKQPRFRYIGSEV